MPAAERPALRPAPTGAPAAYVDVSERPVVASGAVYADTPGKLWVVFLHLLDGAQNDARIARVDPAVVIQIGHPAIAIVDVHVSRIPIHVPTQLGATADSAAMTIVPWRAKPAHHRHVSYLDA